MRKLVSFILVFVLFIFQTTIFHGLSFNGIVPNLIIILTASSGFMQGRKTGLFVGLLCGLLLDTFYGEVLGLYTIIYMYIGYFNGLFKSIFYPEDIKLPLVMISVSDLLANATLYCLLFLLRNRFNFNFYFFNIVIPEIIYTMLMTVIVYPVLLFVYKKSEEYDRNKGQKFV